MEHVALRTAANVQLDTLGITVNTMCATERAKLVAVSALIDVEHVLPLMYVIVTDCTVDQDVSIRTALVY